MSPVVDLCPPLPSRPMTALGPSPMAQVAAFANLAQRCRTSDALLAGAAQVLRTTLPFTHVLVVDCAGQPPVARTAASVGWGDVAAQHLGDLLLTLGNGADSGEEGIGAASQSDCAVTQISGGDLKDLNAKIALAVPSGALAAALSLKCALRGHFVFALLGAVAPIRALTGEDRSAASAVCSILGTTLEFVLRKREYARRLKQVRSAKVAWEGAVDTLPHIVCVLDQEGTITRANRAIEVWGLGSVKSANFRTLHELLHPGCVNPQCGLARRLALALPRSGMPKGQEFEYADPVFGRDLRIKMGDARALSGRDRSLPGRHRCAVIEDITREQTTRRQVMRIQQDLKRNIQHRSQALTTTHEHLRTAASRLSDTQVELSETRRRHHLVLENTNAGLLMVKQGRVAYCNRRFEELLGYARGELSNSPMEDLFPAGCSPGQAVCSVDGEVAASPEHVCQVWRKDGTTIWLRHAEAGFVTENDHVRFITVINVTDQILAEREMQASRRELQRLSRCLMSSQEDERKRISGELHDGLGQSLSAVKLMLQQVASDAAGRMDSELLSACVDKTQEMIEDVRRLSMALRPAIIDSSGVVLAVNRLCRELQQSLRGLAVHLTTDIEEEDVHEPLKIHVFRIAQEALNNIIKHASANNAWIQLDRYDAGLRLIIRDDGVGFAPAEIHTPTRGLGLSSMSQRASLYDGGLTIESEPGRGTTVSAIWPNPVATTSGRADGR